MDLRSLLATSCGEQLGLVKQASSIKLKRYLQLSNRCSKFRGFEWYAYWGM